MWAGRGHKKLLTAISLGNKILKGCGMRKRYVVSVVYLLMAPELFHHMSLLHLHLELI